MKSPNSLVDRYEMSVRTYDDQTQVSYIHTSSWQTHLLFYFVYSYIVCDQRQHIAAPKSKLPGHAASYNPPEEYLFSAEEKKKW